MSNQIFDNTVCLAVTFHRAGQNRRVRRGDAKVITQDKDREENPDESDIEGPDQTQFSIGKRIFASDHWRAAMSIARKFDTWLHIRSLPCPLKRGTELIPLTMLDEVYAKLDQAEAGYKIEAGALLEEYDQLKRESQEKLKDLYREEDYPSPQQLRRAFWVERKLFDFSPPGKMKLSETMFKQERDRWRQTFIKAENEIRLALRESMLMLVSHLAEKLQSTPDGKKKVLRDSAVDKVVEFLDLFDKRNVLNDTELKILVGRARRVLDGDIAMAGALRQDGTVREIVSRRMEEVKSGLDALIKSGPARVISFDEE